ncbi:hypothetical protein DENSPDRAFT_933970 [Dentipellis sp. KUC8613]|nr:hypothetical protein DENSPDRAFT_933970 [Dentipellis sp. KUC8613]
MTRDSRTGGHTIRSDDGLFGLFNTTFFPLPKLPTDPSTSSGNLAYTIRHRPEALPSAMDSSYATSGDGGYHDEDTIMISIDALEHEGAKDACDEASMQGNSHLDRSDSDSDSELYMSLPPSRGELDTSNMQSTSGEQAEPDTKTNNDGNDEHRLSESLADRLKDLRIPVNQDAEIQETRDPASTPTWISYTNDMDLVNRMAGTYRILDLISDQGSGGLVAKIVISQESLRDFVEALHPGAYTSLTKVDFKALDKLNCRPVGVYGIREEIAKFLLSIGVVDEAIKRKLCRPEDDLSGVSEPTLSSGLYFIKPPGFSGVDNTIYVVHWPEPTTWDDSAVSAVARNRVTFIRYLTKLCDQTIAFMSSECARAIVWQGEDADSVLETSEVADTDRLFTFEVAKMNEQEENITARPGFVLPSKYFRVAEPLERSARNPGVFLPNLVRGETSQGFLTARFSPIKATVEDFNGSHEFYPTHLADLLKCQSVFLSNALDNGALDIISNLKPPGRWDDAVKVWVSGRSDIEKKYRLHADEEQARIAEQLNATLPQLQHSLQEDAIERIRSLYPTLPFPSDPSSNMTVDSGPELVRNLCLLYSGLQELYDEEIKKVNFEVLKNPAFRHSKLQFVVVHLILRHKGLDDSGDIHGLLERIISAKDENEIRHIIHMGLPANTDEESGVFKAAARKFWNSLTGSGERSSSQDYDPLREAKTLVHETKDAKFISDLENFHLDDEILQVLVAKVKTAAADNLRTKIRNILKTLPHRLLDIQQMHCKSQKFAEVMNAQRAAMEDLRSRVIKELNRESAEVAGARTQAGINHLECIQSKYGPVRYRLDGCLRIFHDPVILCTIYPFGLSAGDKHELQLNPKFIPKPVVDKNQAIRFEMPTQRMIAHVQLLESDRLLLILVTEDGTGEVEIYLESSATVSGAIANRRYKKMFHVSKIGEDPLFAFDESKRILAVCGSIKLKLHLYAFDESFQVLQKVATQADLEPWYAEYPDKATITNACFVSGTEEILLVDGHLRARVYSFVTLQFRPASVQLQRLPVKVWSSPDGSCLMLLTKEGSILTLTGYHTSTFGSSAGIKLDISDLPSDDFALTAFVNRSSVHVLGLDASSHTCKSVALDITSNITEFMFTEYGGKGADGGHEDCQTAHNCLIDCHAEMWTRFPVQSAIGHSILSPSTSRRQKALVFVCDREDYPLAPYFQRMVEFFQKRTRKPTGSELSNLKIVSTLPEALAASLDGNLDVSIFPMGEWLVGLLCLIPIHIAVCRENRFIPLKDGRYSGDLERSLLGADVTRIVDHLSFGWYESIFQSYLASKPVKVVSSMGEQSVGKSFALNHLADTSFAGSAMRTTEGVWLSVTPTAKNLIVALDFEGVHSIERSAQEDTFLVLFNTAISNLVLFRNNFALSRDITGLFQSFQSSANILDPAANPSLFQSTLLIIIKDVVDTDKSDITREFSLKFQKIVHEERDANFISRLHAGKLNIIPWPVIESAEFYRLFHTVRTLLDKQPTTHHAAGEFLHMMKTLMAKLKANDWGALSQTMAAHRAQTLLAHLPNALQAGLFEIHPDAEHLKNLDTDLPTEKPDSDAMFFVEGSLGSLSDRDVALVTLRTEWHGASLRQHKPDGEWLHELILHLDSLVDLRIDRVREWISVNVARFQTGHASIEDLRRTFNNACVELKASVKLCKAQCATCQLFCVQGRLHEGPHDCKTTHKCIHDCGFCAKDGIEKPCGMVAGHPGKHVCAVTWHLCGEPCELRDKEGCMEECIKPLNHEDGTHMCSAPLHMCGEPCDLAGIILPDGKRWSCPGLCCVPSHEEHTIHKCEDRLCPITCQLCQQLCKEDHLHGLEAGAKHLCGQEHSCSALCADPGVCQIETHPHSIEATFTGNHETFQYTKYTQVARRLDCVKSIPPDQTEHDGSHSHSSEAHRFHFCEIRCDHCGYYCTLPLGHAQPEHETSHGSMSRARWAIDGTDDTIIEHEGRRFSTNDDGAPMMCNLVCASLGRHVHIDWCRTEAGQPCEGTDVEHISRRMQPDPDRAKDFITHELYWRRKGFKDPYSREERTNFAKCDTMCPGPEHSATETNPAQPSYCTLPLFHPLHVPEADALVGGLGYFSATDGHHFSCQNPAVMLPAPFHVVFVIDRSSSMTYRDRRPLPDAPATNRIARYCNNRLGAVYSALYSFWTARAAATAQGGARARGAPPPARRDAYSVVFFDSNTTIPIEDDVTSSPAELLDILLQTRSSRGTNFTAALQGAQAVVERNWNDERDPIVIFLSDGECRVNNRTVEALCRFALQRRKPMSLQTISFGPRMSSGTLQRMAQVALEIQNEVPPDPNGRPSTPSAFHEALSTVNLAETFLAIAETLRKPRGSLLPVAVL